MRKKSSKLFFHTSQRFSCKINSYYCSTEKNCTKYVDFSQIANQQMKFHFQTSFGVVVHSLRSAYRFCDKLSGNCKKKTLKSDFQVKKSVSSNRGTRGEFSLSRNFYNCCCLMDYNFLKRQKCLHSMYCKNFVPIKNYTDFLQKKIIFLTATINN